MHVYRSEASQAMEPRRPSGENLWTREPGNRRFGEFDSPVMMNLSKTVDAIIELRSKGAAADEAVAERLGAILGAANVQTQAVSTHSRALLLAVILTLSIVFLAGVMKKRHRVAFVSALAIPLILFLELSVGLNTLTWVAHGRSDNVFVHFPVQDPAQTVVVGAHYVEPAKSAPGRFAETVSAFLLPMTLVMFVLGLWRAAIYLGKFDFEDAHTIAMVMGSVCAIYYALAFGVCLQQGLSYREGRDPASNAGALATLVALAEDLSQKYPRLENTSVTVAFFGSGRMGEGGAYEFARQEVVRPPSYFISFEDAGRGGAHAHILGDDILSEAPQGNRDLIRAFNRAAVKATGRPLEIVRGETSTAKAFVEEGSEALALTTLGPAGERGRDEGAARRKIDRGQLLVTLQILEAGLLELDKLNSVGP